MSQTAHQPVRIFLSSPGDVSEERRVAHLVIDRLRTDPALRDRVDLQLIAWDDPDSATPMLATMTPQEAINLGFPKPSECEIVITIFWARMGTPLPPEYVKPDGGQYLSGTEWEYLDAFNASRADDEGLPLLVVYRREGAPALLLDDPDFDSKREQWRRVQRFFSSFTNPDGSISQGYNGYATPDDFARKLEAHLKGLIGQVITVFTRRAVPPPAETQPPVLWQGSPFPGLRAFGEADEPIFFGRGRETAEVVDLLRTRRFVSVIGASGSGKSSLVGAGVIPRLRANVIDGSRDWVIVRFTPGELGANPLLALAERTLDGMPMPNLDAAGLASALVHDELALDRMIEAVLHDRPAHAALLFFVDQFEELSTTAEAEAREQAIALLLRLTAHPRARVLITLRADFYNRAIEHEALARLLNEASYALAAPGTGALYEMITRPAERAGLRFEDGLPDRIVSDTTSDPGALPLLAFALDALYHAARTAGSDLLSHAAYAQIGGVQGAIARRADETYKSLDPAAAAALPRVFQELIRMDERGVPTRARARHDRFAGDAGAEALIASFIDKRLLLSGRGEDNAPTIEVAHEALFRAWGRLVTWITEAAGDLRLQDAVTHAAAEWAAHGEDPAYLWANSRNAEVSAMIARRSWQPDEQVQRFIRGETDRLRDSLTDPAALPERRREIGVTLAVLGDTRPGVGVLPDGTPDIAWRTVETPLGALDIAVHPVTIAQFRAFLHDPNGFNHPAWWEGLVRSTQSPPEPSPYANQPMTGVNWHEAVAFARWLTARSGQPVRLPTTAERAAIVQSASSGVGIPANTLEAGLGVACAVGLFPPDVHGLHDLHGNVREWGWDAVDPLAYPRMGWRADTLRPLFGASFDRVSGAVGDIACADPDLRRDSWGFRLALGDAVSPHAQTPPPETEAQSPPPHIPSGFEQTGAGDGYQTALQHLLKLLPRLKPPPRHPDFALIPPEFLDDSLKGMHEKAARSLRDDLTAAEGEVLRPFSEGDYDAVVTHMRYRLIQLSSAALIIMMIALSGVGLWLAFSARTTPLGLVLIIMVVLCLLVIYVGAAGGRINVYSRYMEQRRTAEWLRREYFRYLARLIPYHGSDGARRIQLSRRVRGSPQVQEEAGARPAYAAGQPAHLEYDRRTDEAIYRLVRRGLYEDSRVYFQFTIDRYERVLALCRRITGLALLAAAVCAAGALLLTVTVSGGGCGDVWVCGIFQVMTRLLIITALGSGAAALLCLILPLLYQWERLIAVFQSSLNSLEYIDASSPLRSQPIADDAEYRGMVEGFSEDVLRALEAESSQYGQRSSPAR